MVAAPSHDALLHFTQAILHGIHKIFPRPGPHDNANDKPNSIKKLKNGEGCWATRKEILGLVFDGTTCCINLLADKVTAILHSLKELTRKTTIQIGDLEKSTASCCMQPLVSPMDAVFCLPSLPPLLLNQKCITIKTVPYNSTKLPNRP